MKLPPLDYLRPQSVEEAVSAMAEHGGEAKVLAGGQSLVPLLALRMARPTVLVDLGRVPGLDEVTTDDGALVVGAMTREYAVETAPLVRRHTPLLADAMPLIGHPAIRSRGTLGGTIAHADPAAEAPAVALALDAQIIARSTRGTRTIPATDFFEGFLTTALEEDEVVTHIRFPQAGPRTGACFEEVARRHGDFAITGAGVQLQLDEREHIADARVVLIGVSGLPLRRPEAEDALRGAPPTGEVFETAARAAADGLRPTSDLHGSAAYRIHLARIVVRRALETAARRAEESHDD